MNRITEGNTMEKAKVYFTDFRTVANGDGLTNKLKKLIRKAGIGNIDMEGKFVAIKMHFGEQGNLSFLRPNYARAVVDVVKELGGKPYLTDCNTLYPGSRKNALEHLQCAWENGFTALTVVYLPLRVHLNFGISSRTTFSLCLGLTTRIAFLPWGAFSKQTR